jgi:hypothetical protein
MEIDIDQLFRKVIRNNRPSQPNSYPICLEDANLKELFEFLLEFMTMLCKYYYGDEHNKVNLDTLSLDDLNIINNFMKSIGFECIFDKKESTFANKITYSNLQYNKIHINENTKLEDLMFSMQCGNNLFVIKFKNL